MSQDIAELGLRVDSTQVRTADRALDDFQGTATATSQKVNLLTGALKLLAAAFAAIKLVKLIEETALLNARFETMGVVMNVAGNNAGYTSKQMADLEQELTKTGISMIKARENLTSLATANIDLSKATKLARAAQDLAVVGNTNSSEAFSRLTQGIKSGEVEVLRTLGLNVNFENSYKKLASQLGTTSDKLTEQQKIQARTNATMEAASRYAGIYEEAMGTAGKQIQSLSRYVEDAKVKVGALFNEALTFVVGETTKALKAANAELDKMGQSGGTGDVGHMLAVGFQEAFKAVSVFGANVLFVLNTLGREIGGFGAILAQVFSAPLRAVNGLGAALDLALKGNFSGAADKAKSAFGELGQGIDNVKMIWEDLDKQGEASRAALDAYESSVMGATYATKQQTQAEKDAADAKEQARIAAGEAARAQEAADAKAALARDKAAAALKKLKEEAASFYKSTSENSKDALVELSFELANVEALTAAEKKRIEVLNDLERLGPVLTKAQKDQTKAQQDTIVWLDKLNTARKVDKKNTEDQTEAAIKDVDAARATTKSLEDQIKYYGLTTDAVLKLQAAEYDRKIFWAESDGNDIEVDRLKRLQAETLKQAELQKQLNTMKAQTDFWTSLEDAAHQSFLAIQNGGKDLWTRVKDSAKSIFFEWLYQMTIKKWIINVGFATGGTGAVSGIAGAANLAGATGSASAVTGQLSTLAGLGSLITSAGGIVTGAMQTAGALLSGTIGFGQTLSAGWGALTSGSAAGASAGLASIAGVVAPIAIAALVGSKLLGAAFGMGTKTVNSTTLSGTLTPTGADVSTLQAWSQKGGWFRSDKSGVDSTSVGSAQNSAFASTYKAILDVSKTLGDVIGADTAQLSTRVQQLKIDLTGITDATKQQEAITTFFAGVADSISTELVPGLAAFQQEGEALSTTLQRVVTDYAAVDAVLGTIGKSMGSVGIASISARENLIKVAGGLDALSSGVSYFQQNFLTDAERLAMTQKQVGQALTELGLTGVTSIDQYKQIALGLDLNTEAGAKLFTQMLALAPAFKTVADAADAAKAAADQAAADAAQKAADAAQKAAEAKAKTDTLLGQIFDLTHSEAEAVARQRQLELVGLSATDAALQQRIWLLQDEKTAAEQAAEVAQKNADAQTSFLQAVGNGLVKSMNDAAAAAEQLKNSLASLIGGSMSPLSDQLKYQAAQIAFANASTSDPSKYNSAGNALLQASQALYGTGSYEYARDFAGFANGLQNGIDQQNYIASGAGVRDFYNSLVDSIRGTDTSTTDSVVEAVTNMTQAVTPVLQKIADSTSTQADLTDRVTQGGNATRTTEA